MQHGRDVTGPRQREERPGRQAQVEGQHVVGRRRLHLVEQRVGLHRQEAEPASLLDVGSGSGVLSIAAAKLGFAPVSAVDLDETALEVTAANARANGVAVEVAEELVPADLALMNIALDVVERMLPELQVERAITSGYLDRDEPRVAGWHRVERRVRDGWAADLLELRP